MRKRAMQPDIDRKRERSMQIPHARQRYLEALKVVFKQDSREMVEPGVVVLDVKILGSL